LNKQCAK